MTTHSPFTVTVWDGLFNRKGWVGDPLAVEVTERHNEVSTGTVTVRSDHHRLADLTAMGARLTVDYGTRRVLSGPVRGITGEGPRSSGTVKVAVEGDLRLLRNVLGWPVPANDLSAQTAEHDVRSGPAETVLKGFVTANAVSPGDPTRVRPSVTVAPDLGRGGNIKVQSRFYPLWDQLLEPVGSAGLGIRVVQDDATKKIVLDVYVPAVYPRTLTERSGVVQAWSWSVAAPTATRVIAGDQGERTARNFTSSIHNDREASWRDVIEVFRDARDTDDIATVTQRRADALAEGAPKRGLKVELAESAGFKYGQGIAVGDTVSVEVGPGVVVTDVLREAVLSWTASEGLVVTPVIGERTDDPSAVLARALAKLGRGLRHLAGSR